jgi:oligopeptide/dipeptide ABC transporter ATP-binding protein
MTAPGADEHTAVPVLDVRGLEVAAGTMPIVRGVDLTLRTGQRLGIVGESGSGKSVTALSIMRLLRAPLHITGGQVLLDGVDLVRLSRRHLDGLRGNRISMIYQDPGRALNPLMRVGDQIVEAITLHRDVDRAVARRQAADLLGEVGVHDAARRMGAFPHEFSGGLRQRVMIAIALACEPGVLICDEPTTALDVTTQALVMNLIDRICAERGLSAILITHDLGVASGFCDDIAVMYAGQFVELSSVGALFEHARHPYSSALLASTVDLESPLEEPLPAISGNPPLPSEIGEGCAFRPRCPLAEPRCAVGTIPLRTIDDARVRCIVVEPATPVDPADSVARDRAAGEAAG